MLRITSTETVEVDGESAYHVVADCDSCGQVEDLVFRIEDARCPWCGQWEKRAPDLFSGRPHRRTERMPHSLRAGKYRHS